MTDSTESLLARADHWIGMRRNPVWEGHADLALIRDLRNRVVELEANQCTNPLRSELTCDMLVRDWELCRKCVVELEAQQSSLRKAAQNLFDNRLGWSDGRNPYAPRDLWSDLGAALYGDDDVRVKELRAALLSDAETP